MSITDELREWWVRKFPVMDKELHEDFTAIADRIDVDGDYEPSNCRWVDAATQNANRRPFKYQNGWTKAKEKADAVH